MFTLPETLVYLQVCHYRLHFKIVQYELFLPSSARRRPLMCRTHFESPHNGPVGLLQPIALHRGPTAVLPIELRYLLIFPVSRRAATVFTAPGWSLAAARRPLSFSSSGPQKTQLLLARTQPGVFVRHICMELSCLFCPARTLAGDFSLMCIFSVWVTR